MSFSPTSFDNVEVLRVGVTGPGAGRVLYLVTGVAVINFAGTATDWTRKDVVFDIPSEGGGNPPPLNVGNFQDSTAIAFPATFTTPAGNAVGWGVDSTDTITTGPGRVQLTAKVAVNNTIGTIIRLGFQANILGT
jgi:hypothetical protein